MEYLEYYTEKEGDHFKKVDFDGDYPFKTISQLIEFKIKGGKDDGHSYLFSNGLRVQFKTILDNFVCAYIEDRSEQLDWMRKHPQAFERYKDGMDRDLKYLPKLGWMPTGTYELFMSTDKKMMYHDGDKKIMTIDTGESIDIKSDLHLEEMSIKLLKK